MSENEIIPKKKLLPPTHIPIINKDCILNSKEIMNEDCELILFELPKGFDKSLLNKMKIKKFRTNGKEIKLTNEYKGECYDQMHSIPKQVLTMIPKKKKENQLVFRPVDRYIKVSEALDLMEPDEQGIIKRKLRLKNHHLNEKKQENKRKESKASDI